MKVKLHNDQVRRAVMEQAAREIKENVPGAMSALAADVADQRKVLDDSIKFLEASAIGFSQAAKSFLNDMRATRMAGCSEIHQMIGPLKEVRQLLIGPDYDKEMARLKDFVELCERLEGLKTRGTLDALADTILKLAP